MVIVDKVVVSGDVYREAFVCDLTACKGACCEEGDLGAPLEQEEIEQLEANMEGIKPYLTKAGLRELRKQGSHVLDIDGDLSTPVVKGRECAYAFRDEAGTLKCGIEKAHQAGKSTFKKPISCHLYPIRAVKLDDHIALNYHRWHICSAACTLGEKLNVKIHEFLKEPLIRRFGAEWFARLQEAVAEQPKD